MQSTLHYLATGIQASIHAYQKPLPSNRALASPTRNASPTDAVFGARYSAPEQGLPGWGVVKVVRAGRSGKMQGSKPHNVLREVLVLQRARHPNVVRILEYAWSESVWEHQLALPLLAITLRTLLDRPSLSHRPIEDDLPDFSRLSMASDTGQPFDLLFRSVAFQLLYALAHLRNLGIGHRDIKPENIMLDWDGTVVLIDFGIAWDVEGEDWGGEWKEDRDDMCCEVGTGSYRAPELLFGPTTYSPQAIDLWAAGCVLAEFFTPLVLPFNLDRPSTSNGTYDDMDTDTPFTNHSGQTQTLFDCAHGDLGLAGSIFKVLGSPTVTSWPTFSSLPDASKIAFTPSPGKPLREVLPGLNRMKRPEEVEILLEGLLALCPARRIPADFAVASGIFARAVVLVPEKLLHTAEYASVSGGLRSLDNFEGASVVGLLAEVLSPARRKWDMMT